MVTLEGLEWLKQKLLKVRNVNSLELETLKEERKPVLAGGLAVLLAIFEVLQLKQMQVALGALRQGVLYDLLNREQPTTDLRQVTVGRMMDRFAVDQKQALRVERTALTLYRQLTPIEGMTVQRERIERKLRWAARLHEIGQHISHSSYHRHGAYIIDNAEAPGFALPELHYLGNMVLGHRGKLRKLDVDFKDVGFTSQLLALRLAVILCHARRLPTMEGLQLQRKVTPSLGFTLLVPKQWALDYPQSYFLLQQEVDAWARTDVPLKLQIR